MAQERFAYLFQRYVDKNCSPKELDELMAMLRKPGQSFDLEFVLDSIWENSPEAELPQSKSDELFTQIVSTDLTSSTAAAATPSNATGVWPNVRIAASTFTSIQHHKTLRFKRWLNWAAAVFLICAAGFLLINPPKKESKDLAVKTTTAELPVKSSVPVIVKTYSEHQKVTLPDGSTVVLNNNSSVTYPSVFDQRKREVILSGEGYFDIKHDVKKTFTVLTGKIKTTVLGTSFNIKAYDSDKDITVTVTRGKVSVLGDQAILSVVTPNQQMVFNKGDKKYNVARVMAKNSIQWQESDLFFDDISMEQAAEILAARFNSPIVFANSKVAKCRFTATFLKGESLDEILKVICSYNNAQYEPAAGGITIKGSGCEE